MWHTENAQACGLHDLGRVIPLSETVTSSIKRR